MDDNSAHAKEHNIRECDMLDLKLVRGNPARLREAIRLRKVDPLKANLDRWLELDERRRQLSLALERLNAQRKSLAGRGKSDPTTIQSAGQE